MSDESNTKRSLCIAEGQATSLVKARNREISWGEFAEELRNPVRTSERLSKFLKLPQVEQGKLKAMPGWILGAAVANGRRCGSQIMTRSLITLDCDEITPEILEEIKSGQSPICRFEFVAHTTRKHQPDQPRLRLYLLPDEDFDSAKYDPVARILAEMIDPGMDGVDDVSFRPAQMMFKPSCSWDSEYLCWINEGEPVGVDAVLKDFRLDWRDYENLPSSEKRGQRRRTQEKAENPLEKHGVVGAFCRAYSVEEAMQRFIPDVYVSGCGNGAKARYTYSEGTTSNGVVVEDEGLFIYSYHGSDPCGEKLCNAFDMVRIHRFGHMDEKKHEGSSPKNWPSYNAMEELIADDEAVKSELLADRVDVDAMFDDVSELEESEYRRDNRDIDDVVANLLAPRLRGEGLPDMSKYDPPEKPSRTWHLKELELDRQGRIKSTMPNIAAIIQNDPRLHGAIGLNNLSGKFCVRRTIQSRIALVPKILVEDARNGLEWGDLHDHSLRAMLESEAGRGKSGWSIDVADRDLRAAVMLVAHRNQYHPVIDYFNTLRWDGASRIERLWIVYMGTPDTAYYRETSKLFLLAVICRVFNPGHKWDHAPILKGVQGIRKSTFIKALFGSKWAGELTADMTSNKDAVEQMLGKLCLELPELASMRRSEVNSVKEFMTLSEDRVRLSYDRRMSIFKRQTVFIGTTNTSEYLKDPTGNRRFWPIDVSAGTIDTDRVVAERDQIWAEAYSAWRDLARAHGYENIPLVLSADAERSALVHQSLAQEEDATDVLAERIREWADEPMALSALIDTKSKLAAVEFDDEKGEQMVIPTVITPALVTELALEDHSKTLYKSLLIQVGNAMSRMDGWKRTGGRIRISGYGQGRAYERIGITDIERNLRYRVVADHQGQSSPEEDIL